ncbi:hypothetical protein [Microbacterium sp. ZW T5_56]|uniref:hypothetical protein n=1 Tax=Microbacterium sp. ZW T5_56 TaxID=3378081 RepID=UPI0038518A9A
MSAGEAAGAWDLTDSPTRTFDTLHDVAALTGVFLRELQRSRGLCLTVVGTAIGPIAAAVCLDLLVRSNGTLFAASAPTLAALLGLMVPTSLLALPLVRLRDRGTLRLIATTPARQSSAMLAGVAVATLGTGATMVVFLGTLAISSTLGPLAVAGALASLTFGVGLASLVGAFVRNPATARALAMLAPAVTVVVSDALPWARIFPTLTPVIDLLPTVIIGHAVSAGAGAGAGSGSGAVAPSAEPVLIIAVLIVAVVGVAMCIIGIRRCHT